MVRSGMNCSACFVLSVVWLLGQGNSLKQCVRHDRVFATQHVTHNHSPQGKSQDSVAPHNTLVPLSHLLQHPGAYHQTIIRVRGTVTRLELHLDATHHFIDFVFFLKDEIHQVLVFGRHDRTTGDIQLTSDRQVEVKGLFWKERVANGHLLTHNLEAQRVSVYPLLVPDQAWYDQPEQRAWIERTM